MDKKLSLVTTAVDSECTISAFEKSGSVLAPYYAFQISEALENLSEFTTVDPIMHVPGVLNLADLPTTLRLSQKMLCRRASGRVALISYHYHAWNGPYLETFLILCLRAK